ncbi:MAG: DUF5060 domain-containing protein, partial [Kiritimatiellia bacterium]|nr:DUF5060 domain-containing protein [Kiritimatiellia bacterium]
MNDTNRLQLEEQNPCPDLCHAPWDAWEEATPADVHRIEVGKRWANAGHPEWNHKSVYHRLKFFVPEKLRGRRIGFYCTWTDDQAEVRINNRFAAERTFLAYLPTAPLIADLSPHIHWGEENELLVIVRDTAHTRTGGMVGSVRLFHSLPCTVTPDGGVVPSGCPDDRYHLLLHLGAVRLTRNGCDTFTAAELSALRLPPGILRADELLLPVPAGSVDSASLLPLEIQHVHPGCDHRGLSLQLSSTPAQIGRYELLEWDLDIQATYNNPYDTDEVSVTCLVTCPSGKMESIAAFFAQSFVRHPVGQEEEILLPAAGTPWKLRYRPRETGVYHFEFTAHDPSGTVLVQAPSIRCVDPATTHRGFLRISKNNPRLFAY